MALQACSAPNDVLIAPILLHSHTGGLSWLRVDYSHLTFDCFIALCRLSPFVSPLCSTEFISWALCCIVGAGPVFWWILWAHWILQSQHKIHCGLDGMHMCFANKAPPKVILAPPTLKPLNKQYI